MKKQKKDESIEALEHALKNYSIINCTATYLQKVPITVIHLQLELLEQKLHNYERNKNDIADLDNTLENKLKENLPRSTYQHRLKKMRSRQINFLHTFCNGADGAEKYIAFLKKIIEENIVSPPSKIKLIHDQIAALEKALIGFDNVKEQIATLNIKLESLQKQALALNMAKSMKDYKDNYYINTKNLSGQLNYLRELYNDPTGTNKYIYFLNGGIKELETFVLESQPSVEKIRQKKRNTKPRPAAKNPNIVPIKALHEQITALEQGIIGFDNVKEQIAALKIELESLQKQALVLNRVQSIKTYHRCYYNNKRDLGDQLNYLPELYNDPMGANKYIDFLKSKINALKQELPNQDKGELADVLQPQPSFLLQFNPKTHKSIEGTFPLSNAVPVRNVCGAP